MFVSLLLSSALTYARPWNSEPATFAEAVQTCEGFLKTSVPILRLISLERLSRPAEIYARGPREDIVDVLKSVFPKSFDLRTHGNDPIPTRFTFKTRVRGPKDRPFIEIEVASQDGSTDLVYLYRDSPEFGSGVLTVTPEENLYRVMLRTSIPGNVQARRRTLNWQFSRSGYIESLEVRDDFGSDGYNRVKSRVVYVPLVEAPQKARQMQIEPTFWPSLAFKAFP